MLATPVRYSPAAKVAALITAEAAMKAAITFA
jgi:hypothetical protein